MLYVYVYRERDLDILPRSRPGPVGTLQRRSYILELVCIMYYVVCIILIIR